MADCVDISLTRYIAAMYYTTVIIAAMYYTTVIIAAMYYTTVIIAAMYFYSRINVFYFISLMHELFR